MKFFFLLVIFNIYFINAGAESGSVSYNSSRQLTQGLKARPVTAESTGAQHVQYCKNLMTNSNGCKVKTRTDQIWLQTYQIVGKQCEQELESKNCSQLVKANPEARSKLRDCSPMGICLYQDTSYRLGDAIKGCFWNAPKAFDDDVINLISSVPSAMKDQYNKCYGQPKTYAESTYRRILCAQPLYYIGKASGAAANAAMDYKKLYQDGQNWVKNKNVEMQCFNAQAQSELICYGILNVIVPAHALKVKSPKWVKDVFAKGKPVTPPKPVVRAPQRPVPPQQFGRKGVTSAAKPIEGNAVRSRATAARSAPRKPTTLSRLSGAAETTGAAKATPQKVATTTDSLIVVGVESTEKFKKRLLHYDPVSDADRIDMISFVNTSAQRGSKIIDIENAFLKDLNSLVDQDIVTALTNHHKVLVQDKFKKLLEKYGDQLDFKQYSDFKSQRFALIPKNSVWKTTGIPEKVLKEFEDAYLQANKELADKVTAMGIDKQIAAKMKTKPNTSAQFSADPRTWFKAGIDANADEANWNSRLSRNQQSAQGFARSTTEEIQKAKIQVFKDINSSHQAVVSELGPSSPLLHQIDGVTTVKADVFDLIKKANSNPEEVKKSFKYYYPDAQVSDQAIEDLIKTAQLTDKVQPSIWQTTRTVSSVGDAKHGALLIDVMGMGANNAEQALLQSVKCSSVNFLSVCARAGEREVTRAFQDKMSKIRDVSLKHCSEAKIKCSVTISGDDVRIVPLNGQLPEGFAHENLTRINTAVGSAQVRQAQIIADVPPAARVAIGQDGEAIEKYFREKLRRSPLAEKSKQLTFNVSMKTATVDAGAVRIEVTGAASQGLKASEIAELERIQQEAIAAFNSSKSGRSYVLSN